MAASGWLQTVESSRRVLLVGMRLPANRECLLATPCTTCAFSLQPQAACPRWPPSPSSSDCSAPSPTSQARRRPATQVGVRWERGVRCFGGAGRGAAGSRHTVGMGVFCCHPNPIPTQSSRAPSAAKTSTFRRPLPPAAPLPPCLQPSTGSPPSPAQPPWRPRRRGPAPPGCSPWWTARRPSAGTLPPATSRCPSPWWSCRCGTRQHAGEGTPAAAAGGGRGACCGWGLGGQPDRLTGWPSQLGWRALLTALLVYHLPCPAYRLQYISNAVVQPPQTDDSDQAKFTQNLVK